MLLLTVCCRWVVGDVIVVVALCMMAWRTRPWILMVLACASVNALRSLTKLLELAGLTYQPRCRRSRAGLAFPDRAEVEPETLRRERERESEGRALCTRQVPKMR